MALITCPDCNNAVSDSAPSCPHCGRPLGKAIPPTIKQQPVNVKQEKKTSAFTWGCLIVIVGTLFLGLVGTMVSQCGSKPSATTRPPSSAKPKPKLTSAEHLSEAKKALQDNYKPHKDPMKTTWGRVSDAEEHLKAIKASDPEFKEAQELKIEVKRRMTEINKVAQVVTNKMMITQREELAHKLDEAYLKSGMDVKITLSGKDKTSIKMYYILFSRPLLYKLVDESDLLTTLKKAGFKKVRFESNDTYWDYDLSK